MKLTAIEIKQQKFEKAFRGLDPAEVHSFLSLISSEWEHLTAENRELEEKVEELQKKIKHYERVEEALHETLEAAKQTADTKLTGARKEAEHTVEKAEMEAESIVKEAEVEREKVKQSIRRLLDRRKEIIGRLRSYLQIAHESVDNFARDDEGFFNLKDKVSKQPRLSTSGSVDEEGQKQEKSKAADPGAENIDKLVDDLD